jgi:HEAT repeat protein
MFRMQVGIALLAMGVGHWWAQGQVGGAARLDSSRAGAEAPPPPWVQGDPADSLYRAAREALGRREFDAAAELFGRLPQRFPGSAYAADSFYWRAFALYRVDGEAELREALAALRTQREQFPRAATQGDAAALERRIQGELARRGDSGAALAIERAAKAAPDADCDDDDGDIKLAAVNALLQMDGEKAQPILRRILARRDPESACLRRKAVFLVAQGEAEGAEDLLLATSRSDPDPEVREQAVFWLSQVGTEKAVSALDSILRRSSDRRLQEKALFALSQHESPRAHAALRAYADRGDVPEDLREKAIFWIGQSEDSPESRAWLLSVVRDPKRSIEIRKRALFSVGQADGPVSQLAALYGELPERELKEQVLFALGQRDEPEAVDRLLEIARGSGDVELRKKALFWLGQSDDPRAARALQDIIEQP